MTIYRGYGGVNRQIKALYRGLGGVNRTIKEQYRGYSGVNRKVFSAMPILYNYGDECIAVTGGWTLTAHEGLYTATKEAADIYMYASGDRANCRFTTVNRIDLTNITTLKAIIDQTGGYTGTSSTKKRYIFRATSDSVGGGEPAEAELEVFSNGTGQTISLNVAGLSGLYYVSITQANAGSASGTSYSKTYKIWSE